MEVSRQDVRRTAALAGIEIAEERLPALAAELTGILRHMDVLARLRTGDVDPVHGVGTGGMRLRADDGPQYPFAGTREGLAAETRGGFYVVPRAPSHAEEPPA